MAQSQPRPGWALYLRVSDEDRQSPERSFALQRDAIRETLLRGSNMPILATYEDRLTGTSYDRAQFQEMLADARAGVFSHLAVYRVDRFGRDTAEGLTVAKELRKLGIQIKAAGNPGLDITTPDGWMLFTILLGMGEHEVGVLRIRVRGGIRAKVESGHWCWKAPDGFVNKHREVNSGKTESWVEIDPERAPVVRRAWDLLITGEYSLDDICEELDREGHLRHNGKRWVWENEAGKRQTAKQTLNRFFHNPFYAGWIVLPTFKITWGQVRSKAGAIVTDAEYQRAQRILKDHDHRKRKTRFSYLLQGMLHLVLTPADRIPMQCATTQKGGSSYGYYYIPPHKLEDDEGGIYLRQKRVEEQVNDLLRDVTVRPNRIPAMRDHYARSITEAVEESRHRRLKALRSRLSSLRQSEKAYARLWAQNRLTDRSFDELTAEVHADLHDVQQAIVEIERDSRERIRDVDRALEVLATLSDDWAFAEPDEQRKAIRLLFSEVHVDLAGRLLPSSLLHAPFAYLHELDQSITRVMEGGRDGGNDGPGGPSGDSITRVLESPVRKAKSGALAPPLVSGSNQRPLGGRYRT